MIVMQNDEEFIDVTIIFLSNLLPTEMKFRSDFKT
jgi:hypothetical protein